MGLECPGIKFLLQGRESGVSFNKVVTLGRLHLVAKEKPLGKLLSMVGLDQEAVNKLFRKDGFSDELFRYLGAKQLDVLDFSPYEGANVIQDLNKPIPDSLKNQYSCVLDAGTLEHLFHFPVALENCLRLVAPGGHFITITHCNNFPGHGFYQFSPDVFLYTAGKHNGFEIEDIIVYQTIEDDEWYRIVPPEDPNQRIEFRSCYPVHLMVRARKIGEIPEGPLAVQQPFYADNWWKKEKPLELWWLHGDLNFAQKTRRWLKKTAARILFRNPFRDDYFKRIRK